RTTHVHFAINQNGRLVLTTHCFVAGKEQNARDGLYRSLGAEGQKLCTAEFKPLDGSVAGELAAHFEIVTGVTPEDQPSDRRRPF
ncbi:MAG: intradiol ring-cleavage dioxygenase, partial [Planctomycetales bacterium]|nr:intradiol ring-cleavage dioxygenase [Planctomycetales bacterium]